MNCVAGPPPEAWRGSEGVLRAHQAQPHLSPLLWRQQQRHPQETPEHGGEDLWVSMRVRNFHWRVQNTQNYMDGFFGLFFKHELCRNLDYKGII